jgi:V/A-type H+-transporting ATPase subunit D
MAVMNVNPTRMELTRLKKRLQVARRGYKLLKDKRDELMKKFIELAARNKELRGLVEDMLMRYHDSFTHARSVMHPEMLEEALMFPGRYVTLSVSTRNMMSVDVPEFSFQNAGREDSDVHPYGYAFTSSRLDEAAESLADALPQLLALAQAEKSVQLLSDEIEKTRRRVNALEHVLIPQLENTIRYIAMKLEENERGNLTRLMKVKDMMLERAISERAAQDSML